MWRTKAKMGAKMASAFAVEHRVHRSFVNGRYAGSTSEIVITLPRGMYRDLLVSLGLKQPRPPRRPVVSWYERRRRAELSRMMLDYPGLTLGEIFRLRIRRAHETARRLRAEARARARAEARAARRK